jgi:hypothetical protein
MLQSFSETLPAALVFPVGQIVQITEPAEDAYLPATQSVQTEAPAAEYVPASQSEQVSTAVAPSTAENLPASHLSHEAAPTADANDPGAHLLQPENPADEKVPAEHD